MSADESTSSFRYCGRTFTFSEIARIRALIASDPRLNRVQLSRLVCEEFGWLRPDGRLKEMSCRVAMLRMERDGLLTLPAPQRRNGNGRNRPRLTSASDPQEPICVPARALGEIEFRPVETRSDSSLWNELIERYHYLGYKPLVGAQIRPACRAGHGAGRYLVFGRQRLLAALGFGAAAWALAPRDRFIGWRKDQRVRNLHLVVNNARFLILPWIRSPNLASMVLARMTRRLPHDWRERYGYEPLLLETFVDSSRFRGTCYRAANWIHVGKTQGRGKLDRHKRRALPVKDIFLYPLRQDFRLLLCKRQ